MRSFPARYADNGPEVAARRNGEGIRWSGCWRSWGSSIATRAPHRPQTNGKAERFWRTLNEDLLEGTTFETVEELKEELALYLLYYNTERPHQGLGGKTPLQAL